MSVRLLVCLSVKFALIEMLTHLKKRHGLVLILRLISSLRLLEIRSRSQAQKNGFVILCIVQLGLRPKLNL